SRLWCFDFDGVLCNSVVETGLSGLRAGQIVAPQIFSNDALRKLGLNETQVAEMFVEVRPYLETGFESTILVFMCLEEWRKMLSQKRKFDIASIKSAVESKVTEVGMNSVIDEFCKLVGASKADLKATFTKARGDWSANHFDDWMSKNSY